MVSPLWVNVTPDKTVLGLTGRFIEPPVGSEGAPAEPEFGTPASPGATLGSPP
jgi:hypothetical protein